ncbi:RING-type E3 ubiquitin transferase [Caerostris extrusa]|uniref:RING-type E3 ubiquitin transferase n=1 Tax=Caerostris extrusa TaxID=172846 RepID=A0AAV4X4D8_CAEEX|nr:RING-type E3 ubiquitin transferase [Caerostris extrusa]
MYSVRDIASRTSPLRIKRVLTWQLKIAERNVNEKEGRQPMVFPHLHPFLPQISVPYLRKNSKQWLVKKEKNLEARIRCLRNIQTMLDGAIMQMQQYSSLIASRNINVNTNQSTTKNSNPTMNGGHPNNPSSDSNEELRRRRLNYLQGNRNSGPDENREQQG